MGGSDARLVLLRLFEKQGEDLASGLIDFAIFSENITHDALSCGNTTAGSTRSESHFFGQPSPEKIYQFYSSVSQTVAFSLCDAADYDTFISVMDIYYQVIDSNDDFEEECSEYTSYLEVNLEAGELVFVLVEGYDTKEGDYNLTVIC